jgi:hypothetical protein
MSFSNSIAIGPEFFAKAKNDYSDFTWALVREFFQNSMDAPGSDEISLNVSTEKGYTQFSVENNGAPMTQEILVGKLLSLGGSGKGFVGAVGGFGKAKEVLYFCHQWYKIETGKFVVEGAGAGYNLEEGSEDRYGTRSTILMDGDYSEKLTRAVKRFAAFAQWDGVIKLNGEVLECKLRKGSPRREFAWGTVYTNKVHSNVVVVRVGGIPMFTGWTEFNRCVVIELKGASVDTLTSNRDGLVWKFRSEFDHFLNDLVTNKSRALKAEKPTYTHFSGAKFKAEGANAERVKASARDLVGVMATERIAANVAAYATGGSGGTVVDDSRLGILERMVGRGLSSEVGELVEQVSGVVPIPKNVISEEFILKNETRLAIPTYYHPGLKEFSTYGKKLARIWGRLVLELHRMLKMENEFGIGFVFSEDAEAQYEKTSEFGTIYYLNPAKVVEQVGTSSKSFKKRFKLTERDRILSIAVHEVVHGEGYSSHNEEYAGRLTDVFAMVLRERKRFNWCFA